MKLRVQLHEAGKLSGTRVIPPSHSLRFGPNGEEDAQFVAMGPGSPGRHMPILTLRLEQLTAEAVSEFELGGEYLLTLERVAKR